MQSLQLPISLAFRHFCLNLRLQQAAAKAPTKGMGLGKGRGRTEQFGKLLVGGHLWAAAELVSMRMDPIIKDPVKI